MFNPMVLTVTPAYGRDYKSKAAVLAAWNEGKDFQVAPTGQYCSIRDVKPGMRITFRYAKLRQAFVLKVS